MKEGSGCDDPVLLRCDVDGKLVLDKREEDFDILLLSPGNVRNVEILSVVRRRNKEGSRGVVGR